MNPPTEVALTITGTGVPACTLLPVAGLAITTSGGMPMGATVRTRSTAVPVGEIWFSLLSKARASTVCSVGDVLEGE